MDIERDLAWSWDGIWIGDEIWDGIRIWDGLWIWDEFGIWIRDGFGVWVWDGYDGLDIGRVMDTGWDMGWDMDMGWLRDGAVVVIGPWGLWGWDAAVSPKHPPV